MFFLDPVNKDLSWISRLKWTWHYITEIENVVTREINKIPSNTNRVFDDNSLYKAQELEYTNWAFRSLKPKEREEFHKTMNKHQRAASIPWVSCLTRKDEWYRNYWKLKSKFPNDINYMVESYIFPEQKQEFLAKYANYQKTPDNLWLLKPVNSSRGRRIRFMEGITDTPDKMIATRYIHNPKWINNKISPLRIYVLVTGFTPLKIYMYNEGFCRFGNEEFKIDVDNWTNLGAHLTNFNFVGEDGKDIRIYNSVEKEIGNRWFLNSYKKKLQSEGHDVDWLFKKIKDVIVKSVLSVGDLSINSMQSRDFPSTNNVFELFGVDIVVDNDMNPWWLEYNYRPNLKSYSDDVKVLSALVTDIWNKVGVVLFNHVTGKPVDKECVYRNRQEQAVEESLNEFARYSGGFERWFPLKENIDVYSKYLDNPGEENEALWKRMKGEEEVIG